MTDTDVATPRAADEASTSGRDAATGARRILVVWNPHSGEKAGVPTNPNGGDDLRAAMTRHHLGDELFESPSEAESGARVDEAVGAGYDVVIAAGGDGTVRSVAKRLLGRETALGILPLGSAMNLARALGIPRELEPAAAVIQAGHVRSIDVGSVDGELFIEQVNVGLSAEAFAKAQQIDKRRWGAAFGLLRLLLRRERTHIELDVDGEHSRTRALALTIANLPYTGMGIELAPGARPDDGLLDIVIYEGLSALWLARYMAATFGGRGDPPQRFRTLRARDVRVETHRRLAVRYDAFDGGVTPIEVRARPGELRVLAPAD
jgi:YegS/Rv2252/BmrU family lipid kinase